MEEDELSLQTRTLVHDASVLAAGTNSCLNHLHSLFSHFVDDSSNVHSFLIMDLFKSYVYCYKCTSSAHTSTEASMHKNVQQLQCIIVPAMNKYRSFGNRLMVIHDFFIKDKERAAMFWYPMVRPGGKVELFNVAWRF